MDIDFSKIKLVIWDLDETFWKGVLSEGTAEFDDSNALLIRNMTDAGIISSICSKNDEQQVLTYMKQHSVADLFVFNSINWAAKGSRVKQIISEMNLRAANVLFIDDNPTNLGEASEACPELMVSDETIIPKLKDYFSKIEKCDIEHKRLMQYRVLEEKQNFRATVESNDDFLRKCKIQVDIKKDCENHLERIAELVMRSNQLNFTKVRSSARDLQAQINNKKIQTGYVVVHDKFGDYGIVGFYAIEAGRLLHFVFSCRILNMGVEQYVYHELGCPEIAISGDVSSSLDMTKPNWINQFVETEAFEKKTVLRGKKIVVKGPCDMQQIFAFIKDTKAIKTEFVYVNNYGVSIEQGCHTTHIVESQTLEKVVKQRLVRSLPFGDKGMFQTNMFDDDVGFVILSMFTDPNLGLYREKRSGAIVAFGEYTNDLTDESLWQAFVNQSIFTANCKFTLPQLKEIKRNYEFIGRIKPEGSIKNLDFIYQHLAPQSQLLLCLGSEIPFEANQKAAYEDRHIYHRDLNHLIREWASDKPNVFLLDTNKLIDGQQDFTNNINHFTKKVYYKLSEQIVSLVNQSATKKTELQFATENDQKRSVMLRKIKKIPNIIARRINGSK